MVESPAAADRAFDFLHRRDIGTLYLYADAWHGRNLIVDAPDAYRDFIARAHRKGFQVYALLGSADLHGHRKNFNRIEAELGGVPAGSGQIIPEHEGAAAGFGNEADRDGRANHDTSLNRNRRKAAIDDDVLPGDER